MIYPARAYGVRLNERWYWRGVGDQVEKNAYLGLHFGPAGCSVRRHDSRLSLDPAGVRVLAPQ